MNYVYIVYKTPHKLDGTYGARRVHKVYINDREKAFTEAFDRHEAQADWAPDDRSLYQIESYEAGA